jgi:hypothetical protein
VVCIDKGSLYVKDKDEDCVNGSRRVSRNISDHFIEQNLPLRTELQDHEKARYLAILNISLGRDAVSS